jgi:hypothetical protein
MRQITTVIGPVLRISGGVTERIRRVCAKKAVWYRDDAQLEDSSGFWYLGRSPVEGLRWRGHRLPGP